MATGKRDHFYHSMAWRNARHAYLAMRMAIDGGLCETCHIAPGNTVHHKIWLTDANVDDPDIALNPNNFKLLCHDCHAKEENDQRQYKHMRFLYDSDGNVRPN